MDPILSIYVEVGVNWFRKLADDMKMEDDANRLKTQEKMQIFSSKWNYDNLYHLWIYPSGSYRN